MLELHQGAVLPPTARRLGRLSHRLARHVGGRRARLAPAGAPVSLTFDDAPDSACTVGADLLARYGATGTYYVSSALIGTRTRHWRLADADRIAAVHRAGHEIGCHTHTHAYVPSLGAGGLREEIRRNRAGLREIVPGWEPTSFAYPYGFASLTAKRVLREGFGSARGIGTGLNVGLADRDLLRANPLTEADLDAGRAVALMDEAVARGGWLIFYGHDVTDRPSPYGCTPALLDTVLRAAADRAIPCVSVAQGLRRAMPGPA